MRSKSCTRTQLTKEMFLGLAEYLNIQIDEPPYFTVTIDPTTDRITQWERIPSDLHGRTCVVFNEANGMSYISRMAEWMREHPQNPWKDRNTAESKLFSVKSGLVTFTVRIVGEGDRYGLGFCMCYDRMQKGFKPDDPLVEFYESGHNHTEFGWFISRYYASTMLKHAPGTGLCLQGDVERLTLTADAYAKLADWLNHAIPAAK